MILDAAMQDAVPAIAAAGASPIVRIPDMQGWMVKRELKSLRPEEFKINFPNTDTWKNRRA